MINNAFPLDRPYLKLDPIQNTDVKDVQSGVNLIGDEFPRFLDETLDPAVFWTVNDDAIFRRFFHFRHHDRSLKMENGEWRNK